MFHACNTKEWTQFWDNFTLPCATEEPSFCTTSHSGCKHRMCQLCIMYALAFCKMIPQHRFFLGSITHRLLVQVTAVLVGPSGGIHL